ncbi:hypothetical protein AB0953_33445 [Streptomyces sp. NPDC046866]|uniref:hypothetical protein n=1 Tax=Streptomyces sp. NPDC046866 TaxID=3154921 RepID=UPI0034545DE1
MPFEDELGEALRRAGDGFTTDRHALVEAGERRGRRLVARRRAAVIGGSVLSLALIGAAGAYTGGLLDGPERLDVAAPPTPQAGQSGKNGGPDARKPSGTGAVSGTQMVAILKELLPPGDFSPDNVSGTETSTPSVGGVYDDGKGKSTILFGLGRVDPDGFNTRQLTECGDKNLQEYDDCTVEQLPDGSKVLVEQGYEYSDRRANTKVWRATLVTPQGFHVQASENNSPAEKGAGTSRTNPPLTPAQLKAVVTSDKWRPALNDLPAADEEGFRPGPSTPLRDKEGLEALEGLVAKYGIPVASKGGEHGYGYVVLDDGKGTSLVQVNVVEDHGAADFPDGHEAPLADGTRVKVTQRPAEKGKGVVEWTVDTLRKNGLRVTLTAYNTANISGGATRKAPALTLEQMKELATAPAWNRDRN